MNIGYARVSANHQNLDRQIALLKSAGCKQIFKEKQSGREGIKRPQLDKAIDALSPSDVLIGRTDEGVRLYRLMASTCTER